MSDDWDDPDFDDEQADDLSDGEISDDEVAMLACPACGEQIYEDAQQCPYCGDYVTHASSALVGRPWWFVLLGIAGILAFIFHSLR